VQVLDAALGLQPRALRGHSSDADQCGHLTIFSFCSPFVKTLYRRRL
jgi:hypothetical protein